VPAEIVVLGGGVGGTLAANLLSRELKRDGRVTVVDPTGLHVYQPGFLYVALGQAKGRWLARPERHLLRRDVDLAIEGAERVDAEQGFVRMEGGSKLPFDHLVVATGARLAPDQVPGMSEGAHHFYSLLGAEQLHDQLLRFRAGMLVVRVAGLPYKCPPAPIEFLLMVEQ